MPSSIATAASVASAGSSLASTFGIGSGSGSAKRQAANAARQERELAQRQQDSAKAALSPYSTGGSQAAYKLSQLMGLDNFDRDMVANSLKKINPDLFAQEASVQTRKRAKDSASYAKYGDGTQYLINGEWSDIPDTATKYYTPEQNAAIDAAIEAEKQKAGYGDLTKEFSLSDYIADPGYQFRLDEGNKANERANARRGNFYSGAAIKEANRYNSGMASQEYGSAYDRFMQNKNTLYNRLSGISASGQNAVGAQIGVGQNTTASMVNSAYSQANANIAANAAAREQRNQGIAGLSSLFGGGQSSYANNSGQNGLPWQMAGNRNPLGGFYTGYRS